MSSYRLEKERGFGRREIRHESTSSSAHRSIPCELCLLLPLCMVDVSADDSSDAAEMHEDPPS